MYITHLSRFEKFILNISGTISTLMFLVIHISRENYLGFLINHINDFFSDFAHSNILDIDFHNNNTYFLEFLIFLSIPRTGLMS